MRYTGRDDGVSYGGSPFSQQPAKLVSQLVARQLRQDADVEEPVVDERLRAELMASTGLPAVANGKHEEGPFPSQSLVHSAGHARGGWWGNESRRSAGRRHRRAPFSTRAESRPSLASRTPRWLR